MFEFLSKLLNTEDFPPRWHCGDWTVGHGWLHIGSDLATSAAYITIPFVLVFFLRRRPDLPFHKVFYMFAAFIFACGAVHLIEAGMFWWPVYRLSGMAKLITAVVSWGTVISIIACAGQALAMRTPGELKREIESRKEAEENLREGEERLSMVIQATDDIIWDLDLTASTFWSDEALEGLAGSPAPRDSTALKWWAARVHPDERDQNVASFQAAMASPPSFGNRWSAEYRFRAADGRYRHMITRALIRRGSHGKPVRIIGAMNDITATVHARSQLMQSERLSAIGQAMTGLIHESRNGLARSQAGMKLLSRQIGDRPELFRYIDEALQAQKDVQHLFEEVRQYAVPPKITLELEDVSQLVQKTWDRLQDLRGDREATLLQDFGGVDVRCRVDGFAIGNVFRNLIENSLAAGSDPVRISLTYCDAVLNGDSALEIVLRNNGPKLTAEESRHAFDAFYTTKTNGTGLGLAIVKRTVELHRGEIQLCQTEIGAEFRILIPRGNT